MEESTCESIKIENKRGDERMKESVRSKNEEGMVRRGDERNCG